MLTRSSHLCVNVTGRRKAHSAVQELATLLIFIFCAGINSLLQAQVSSGIQGTVTDQRGQPIAGAEVLVRANATGAVTKSITDSDGTFGVVG